jgi:predicted RNA methylase
MTPYEPIRYPRAGRILDRLRLTSDDIFVDMGCGKGRVVFVAAIRNIKKAVGIELDEKLFGAARDNLRTIKLPHSPVEFINADAATFDITEGTIFYFYHPFGYRTTMAVLEKIKKYALAKHQSVRIVIMSSSFPDVFQEQDWLRIENEIPEDNAFIFSGVVAKS